MQLGILTIRSNWRHWSGHRFLEKFIRISFIDTKMRKGWVVVGPESIPQYCDRNAGIYDKEYVIFYLYEGTCSSSDRFDCKSCMWCTDRVQLRLDARVDRKCDIWWLRFEGPFKMTKHQLSWKKRLLKSVIRVGTYHIVEFESKLKWEKEKAVKCWPKTKSDPGKVGVLTSLIEQVCERCP